MATDESRPLGRETTTRFLARLMALAPAAVWRPLEQWRSLLFWKGRKRAEGALGNDHYEYAFTSLFGLDRPDFADKTILDVGSGPRGSLEWAGEALERVGLDVAADSFRAMGARNHQMRYLPAPADDIPVCDKRFDIVSAFNVLDRVEDVDQVITEIERVVAPGGMVLLMSIVNHDAPGGRPLGARQRLEADLASRFDGCTVERSRLSRLRPDGDVYRSAFEPDLLPDGSKDAQAVLCVRLRRNAD